MTTLRNLALALALLAAAAVAPSGCSDSGTTDRPRDLAALPDGGARDSAQPSCFEDPKTHVEIINACTDAEKIDKKSTPPLLEDDGTLPPLP